MSEKTKFKKVYVIDHPLIVDSLTHLRDKYVDIGKFRRHSDQLCRLLFAEAIRGLDFEEVKVTTPLEIDTKCKKLKDEIIVVAKLRSGLAMMLGALKLLPKSKMGFAGLERDEEMALAKEYYWEIPKIRKNSVVIITDPMLATGGTILHILEKIHKEKPKRMRIVCIVAAPEGIRKIRKKFPQVEIFTAAIDSHLNEAKFIVPGIGDYGDRYCGTSV